MSGGYEGFVRQEDVLKLACDMIRIPSMYTKEAELSEFIFRKLDSWGLAPESVPVDGHGPDVVAELGDKSGPVIVLNGHMDTVDVMQGWIHDPFGAKVENGLLYGLGSLDMKCGLACLMMAFRALAEADVIKGFRVCLQAVTGEEDTGRGSWTLVKEGKFQGAKGVIVGEGFGGLGAITVGRRGGSYYDIHVKGKSAHGASPHLGINAISDAARIVSTLDGMGMIMTDIKGDDGRIIQETQSVLSIDGGGPSLSIPEKCHLKMVRCTVPGGEVDHTAELQKTISDLGLQSQVDVVMRRSQTDPYHPYLTPTDSPLVRSCVEAIEARTGKTPRLVMGRSEADDNLITQNTGLPVLCMGPGEEGPLMRYHQPEEAINVAQLESVVKVYCDAVLRLGKRL